WFCRAWLGARVEWVGEVAAWVDEPEPCDYGPVALARAEVVAWRGHAIHVPPLDLQLAVCARRGLDERVVIIRQWMEAHAQEDMG
ncbi:MAG: hypothetical protein JW910_23090, partial [Anaerolineae bacterium]|nr:hypothetical protein [Anaerolineae bacterium]